MAEHKQPMPGDHVIYHDPLGRPLQALCTADWGGCINVLFISGDGNKKDQYGRQIERETSVAHKKDTNVHGRYWRWPHEDARPVVQPVAS
jgi:hypothetical protein